ncbi:MAG: outer membrane lipoprotein carrier protein LolA [Deltaproteobacteria bacterium]|nr:outer membrane lipoprotein carrier protein LolA [Deltaproteobacteria bacterium]MBW2016365.1 outer membrane lipoprotein carrier protein LolA [Deltaproteobacteria bacterium]MBW2129805.1 outer membrane lipoprotein carrier protein LolA [Deltaproteobacteria bacterium]MBW2304558.1 outer membrane lipoprotein carrier protein LolA [Deltaproteobacteria bacterium]
MILWSAERKHCVMIGAGAVGLLFFLLFLASSTPCLGDPDPGKERLEAVLTGIKGNYAALPGLTVPYERDVVTRSMAILDENIKSDVASGLIHFKPPHFLRIEQRTPRTELVISDGQVLWWYIPEKKEAYRYSTRKMGKELKLLSDVFQGLKEVEDGFQVELTDPGECGPYHLKLIPQPPWTDIDFILLDISREDYTIQSFKIHNYLGGFTRFTLGDPTIRKGFEKGFFAFVPPEGVRIIKEED